MAKTLAPEPDAIANFLFFAIGVGPGAHCGCELVEGGIRATTLLAD